MKKFESKGHFCAPLPVGDNIFWLCSAEGTEFSIPFSTVSLIWSKFINLLGWMVPNILAGFKCKGFYIWVLCTHSPFSHLLTRCSLLYHPPSPSLSLPLLSQPSSSLPLSPLSIRDPPETRLLPRDPWEEHFTFGLRLLIWRTPKVEHNVLKVHICTYLAPDTYSIFAFLILSLC